MGNVPVQGKQTGGTPSVARAVWDPFWFMHAMLRWGRSGEAPAVDVKETDDAYVYKVKLRLPSQADVARVKAELDNGELTLVVPKAAAATPVPEAAVAAPGPEAAVAAPDPEAAVAAPGPEAAVAMPGPEATPLPEAEAAAPEPEAAAAAPEPVSPPPRPRRTTGNGRGSAARTPPRGTRSPSRRD